MAKANDALARQSTVSRCFSECLSALTHHLQRVYDVFQLLITYARPWKGSAVLESCLYLSLAEDHWRCALFVKA